MSTGKHFNPVHFGRYLLEERIAVGGMAEIFRAKFFGAMGFEKPVVIKRILPQFAADAEFLRMFITEAKLVCHLEHPNIAQVYELGEIEGRYYIAMEHINGIDGRQLWRTLAKRKQRLPGVLALFVVAEFVKGLDYAHRAVGPDNALLGVVHRDVSPSNILINFRGDVKIGDFGIALVQQESRTQAGVLKGKYGYMSPEQVAGLPVDHRSDIFAAGIVLAELLLGRRLFLGRSDFETLDKVMNVKLDILEQHEKALPPEVVRIVKMALQRDPADRYQSARDFHDDLMEFLFSGGDRISNETLAAFIAQHVAPYLARKTGPPDASGSNTGGDISGAAAAAQSPVLPRNLVPKLEASEADIDTGEGASLEESNGGPALAISEADLLFSESVDTAEPAESSSSGVDASAHAGEEFSIGGEPPTPPPPAAPAPGQDGDWSDAPHAPIAEQGATHEDIEENAPVISAAMPDSAQGSLPVVAMPGAVEESQPSVQGLAGDREPTGQPISAQWDASITPGADGGPQFALWDNVINPDYQFGAIPQLDLGESSTSDIALDGFTEGAPRKAAIGDDAFLDAPGTELDLDSGLEEHSAFHITNEVQRPSSELRSSTARELEDPAMLRAQLQPAIEPGPSDLPDFAGDLGTRTVAKVLLRFGAVQESGLLTITGPGRLGPHADHLDWIHDLQAQVAKHPIPRGPNELTCEILLEHGQPKTVAADRSEPVLAAYLLCCGALEREDIASALKAHPHRSLVAALLASAKLTPLQISRHVTSYVLDSVFESFAWSHGTFAFHRGREIGDESFPTGMDLLPLVKRGIAAMPTNAFERYFSRIRGDHIRTVPNPPAALEDFGPDPILRGVYSALGQTDSPDHLLTACAHLADPLALKRALYTLIECDLATRS